MESKEDAIGLLKQYKELKDSGILTDEEYEKLKSEALKKLYDSSNNNEPVKSNGSAAQSTPAIESSQMTVNKNEPTTNELLLRKQRRIKYQKQRAGRILTIIDYCLYIPAFIFYILSITSICSQSADFVRKTMDTTSLFWIDSYTDSCIAIIVLLIASMITMIISVFFSNKTSPSGKGFNVGLRTVGSLFGFVASIIYFVIMPKFFASYATQLVDASVLYYAKYVVFSNFVFSYMMNCFINTFVTLGLCNKKLNFPG